MAVRWRQKEAPCVLCGEGTRDWDRVCNTCRSVYALGQRVEALDTKRPQGTVRIVTARYWKIYEFYGNHDHGFLWTNDPKKRIVSSLLELVGAVKEGSGRGRYYEAVGIPPGTTRPEEGETYLAIGNEHTAQILQGIYLACCDLAAYNYDEGLSKGKSLLFNLSQGKLDPDAFTKLPDVVKQKKE